MPTTWGEGLLWPFETDRLLKVGKGCFLAWENMSLTLTIFQISKVLLGFQDVTYGKFKEKKGQGKNHF